MLAELIKELPDEQAYLVLLNRFEKLLRKYANILGYEDAYQDLQLFFLSLVLKMGTDLVLSEGDGAIVAYIAASIKHHFYTLSRNHQRRHEMLYSELSDEQLSAIEKMCSAYDEPDISEYFPIMCKLSEKEKTVIREIFVEGYSVQNVADRNHISRQAVNQLKLRAIKKIRSALWTDEL